MDQTFMDLGSPVIDEAGEANGALRTSTLTDISNDEHDTAEINELFLTWVSPFNFTHIYNEYLSKRLPGTLAWFFESSQYNNWVEETSGNMNCHGKIGTGKTILTSAVISDLSSRFENRESYNVGIAYFYCDFNKQSEQSEMNILRALLRQLVPTSHIQTAFEKASRKRTETQKKQNKNIIKRKLRGQPIDDDVWHAFPLYLDLYSKVFIILDAVDELDELERTYLFTTIENIQATKNINIFYTSRLTTTREVPNSSEIEMINYPEQVERYVKQHVENLCPFLEENSALRELVQETIIHRASGSFSTAASYLDSLRDTTSEYAVLSRLSTIPEPLNDSYTKTMHRIKAQDSGCRSLGTQVLSWLTYVKRPLVYRELQGALGVELLSDGFAYVWNGPPVSAMVEACIGLVEVDAKSHVIRFVHDTIRGYLSRNEDRWFPEAESNIASVCIGYLLRRGLGFRRSDETFENHLREYPFYDYAAHNWGSHLRSITANSTYLEEFLSGENEAQAACQAMLAIPNSTPECDDEGMLLPKSSDPNYSQQAPRGVSGLHLVAHIGKPDVAALILEKGLVVNCRDSNGQTPLWWAARAGNHATMTLLAEKDAITLHLLLGAKEEDLARRVIACGYRLDVVDFQKRTPLHAAVISRCAGVVHDLIHNGANIEAEDVNRMTPLQLALSERATNIIIILLRNRPRTVDVSLDTWQATFGLSVSSTVGLFDDLQEGFSLRVVTADEMVRLWRPEAYQDTGKCLIHTPPVDFITSPSNVLEIESTESPDRRRWVYSAYVTFPSDRNPSRVEKFSIQWSVVIDETDHWRSVIHFTNLPHLWIPSSGTEFFENFIIHLEHQWEELCRNNQARQDYVRERIFHYRGHNPGILDELLEDGQYWFELRRILWDHVAKARSFGLEYGVRHDETDASPGLLQAIDAWSENITERIDRLEESSKDLIQLEFNLVSINEARKSTTTSTSMNRLSWITFFFLPLTFVSGLFGMNVDLLESNPSWWLYLVFASGTLVITCSVWVVFKRNPLLRPSLERRFAWLLGPADDPNYAPTAPYGLR